MKNKVLVGRVGRAVGRDGKYRIFFFAQFPKKMPEIFYSPAPSGVDIKPACVNFVEKTGKEIFMSFATSEKMTGKFLFADKWSLEHGHFWIKDLIGCEVFDKNCGFMGSVVSVKANLPQVWLNMEKGSLKIAIPFVREIVKRVEAGKKRILAEIPQGISVREV